MGMIALVLIAAALLGSALIAALSQHLARLDDARDAVPPSFLTYGDEP